jgi:glyoxylase-like metal-dependent hydrolase (beta-lactamase superfamily II)
MAKLERRHPANVAGPWFVDTSCIDCDICRQCAPTMFGDAGGQSIVVEQPISHDETTAAMRAMLACPTASIGTTGPKNDTAGLFPQEIDQDVFFCGFASEKSYGANSFFARRTAGNFLVDSPRFVPQLLRRLEDLGGVHDVLLTHRDDVADAARYASHFGARVWIHEADRKAAPFATDILKGNDPIEIRPGLCAIPVPGHTQGSVMFLLEDRFLFTGDSLCWNRPQGDLMAFREYTWYSWEIQTKSLARLAAFSFEWVLAGHGDRQKRPAAEMRERLVALVERMGRRDGA